MVVPVLIMKQNRRTERRIILGKENTKKLRAMAESCCISISQQIREMETLDGGQKLVAVEFVISGIKGYWKYAMGKCGIEIGSK